MRTPPQTFGTLAATLSAGVLLFATQTALAQTASPPNATATRPARVLPDQNSVPSSGPPATTGQTTGEVSRDPTIKQMNDDEKRKVDTKGK
ncbi:hypothetical protein J2R76_004257 [Bradyrhizobium sp. USDA 4532]|uniref:hypothetical protein n=1 Tax=unclassified Bradyrhizobium TaxID=2631580 RepID=UPI0020A0079E|nr:MULTISPECIES: hypothetical protein [unclassified Bradyrhizobium]MCP1835918.1 hypothetical protein [Bradyrhizobium sp. USDA 4545]MCP1920666.1 hypothetical protein [Bradyrhizobium sp. USDA 4532]